MRPGELTHLLLPDDLDLESGWLHIRNKPALGWQVKTRNERSIPLVSVLADVLRIHLGERKAGTVFRQRRCTDGHVPPLDTCPLSRLERETAQRVQRNEAEAGISTSRADRARIARFVWRDIGAIKPDRIRLEFMRLTRAIGLPHVTAPKTFRHTFATNLQDANVDPLVRNELMGHAPATASTVGVGLAMTAVYTHTRPETKRRQLEQAMVSRPAIEIARRWVNRESERISQPGQ